MTNPTLKLESLTSILPIPTNLLDDQYVYHKYNHGPGKRYHKGTYSCTECRKPFFLRYMEAELSKALDDSFAMLLPYTFGYPEFNEE